LHKVENLFTQLHPELDLEDALANSSNPARNVGSPSRPQFQDESARSATTGPETPGQESITETVPDDADGFDWSEDVDDIADGMAALAVEPKGTGYLGSTAGVFFLRSLLYQVGQTTTAANANILQSGQSPIYATGPGSPSAVAQTLSSRHSMDRLLDAYFSVYHRTYPFVHEASFRAQYHEVIPRPRSFDILLYTILALGAWCLDDNDSHLDSQLYQRALSFREDETLFERADLTFLQALILLSNLSQKLNKPNTGSNFLGLAVRMALSLGLHRELPDWDISLLNREMRRRVWWGLYMFDSGAATTFGRPILLPGKESMDVRPVLNIHDEVRSVGHVSTPY
jgi:transcriptional regulatory protein GAL4